MAPPQSCWIQVLSPGVHGYPGLSHGHPLLTTCSCPAPRSRHAGQVNARSGLSSAQSRESWATSTRCPAVPRACRARSSVWFPLIPVETLAIGRRAGQLCLLMARVSRQRCWAKACEAVSAGGSTGPPSSPVRQGRGGLGGVCDQIPVSTLAIWVPWVGPPGSLSFSVSVAVA